MKNRLIVNVILLFLTIDLFAQIATISGTSVEVDNGVISAIINGGKITSLNLKGQSNLLANGGLGYFSFNDSDGYHSPSSATPNVTVNNSDIADIYFTLVGSFEVEMHYVFRKNESGFNTYMVISDNGVSYKTLSEARFALRVDEEILNYGWTVEREGEIVSSELLKNYVNEIQDATYELTDGTIYTKYDWAVYRNEDLVHGLLGNGTGLWNIEASREYVNGGPTMQDLTLHGTNTTPILTCYFHSSHFGSQAVYLKREYESWNKIYGPNFIYINNGTKEEVISDAILKAKEQETEWPYAWLQNDLYPINRGTLSGALEMSGHGVVDSAMVLLCETGPSWLANDELWQSQPYSYFFSDVADQNGNFSIKNIRPGTYDLYAYTQKGKLIDGLKKEGVIIQSGINNIGDIIWNAGDKENTILQLGIANHKSNEFALANLPRLYGRWYDTPDNLTFNTSVDNMREDWYYCQRVSTTWDINFNIESLDNILNPTLKIAIAGADAGPHLDAIVNGTTVGTMDFGSDSGIRRSSLHSGKYSEYKFSVNKYLLVNGNNTLSLNCYGSPTDYKGIMYDAILLESDLIKSSTGFDGTSKVEQSFSVSSQNHNVLIYSSVKEICTLRIYSITGALQYESTISHGENVVSLTQSGVYIVSICAGNELYKQKLVCNK